MQNLYKACRKILYKFYVNSILIYFMQMNNKHWNVIVVQKKYIIKRIF